jgi:hypothetical protein
VPNLTPYAPLVMVLAAITGLIVWIVGKRRGGATVPALLVVTWGVVVATTLTPSPYQAFDPRVTCNFALNLGLVPTERLANVLLFVPLGLVSWFALPRWLWVALAVVTPFVIEASQGQIVAMNRACDVMDVAANVLGVALGVGLALVSSLLWKRSRTQ